MRILVTGANGLIGKKVVKQLIATGNCEVVATSQKRLQFEGIQTFTSDLLNADINSLIEKIKPDSVVHCAALSSPDACEVDRFHCKRMNIGMVERFGSACRDYNVHFVLLSTDFVFDGIKGNYSETDNINPITFYGESKLAAEKILADLGIDHAIIRTAQVFGFENKLSRQNYLTRCVKQLASGKEFKVAVDRIRSFTLAEDLAVGIETVATNRLKGIYHIAGSDSITFGEYAQLIAKTFGYDSSLLNMIPANQMIEAAPRPFNSSLVIEKAKQELNYKTTPIDEAVAFVKSQMPSL